MKIVQILTIYNRLHHEDHNTYSCQSTRFKIISLEGRTGTTGERADIICLKCKTIIRNLYAMPLQKYSEKRAIISI